MGFALVVVLMAAGSLNLSEIVNSQRGSSGELVLVAACCLSSWSISSRASPRPTGRHSMSPKANRKSSPDFHVEYSGMPFSVFFMAEYANMVLISVLTTIFFLGGWLSPLEGVIADRFMDVPILGHGFFWFAAKVLFFMFLYLWLRATFPRYRYDQIMRLGWKVFIPITIVWIVVVGIAIQLGMPPWFD